MRKILAALFAACLLLVACGGDDDDAAPTTTDTSEEDEGGNGGEADAFDFSSEDCREIADAINDATQAIGGSGGGPNTLDETRQFLDELRDQVPDDVKEDFGVLAEAFTTYLDRLEDAGIDPGNPQSADPEDLQQLAQAAQVFADADVVQASQRISQFVTEECGTN